MKRTFRLAALFCACLASCSFSAHPPNGTQACSTDNPPQCPDGYRCATGLCYLNAQLPATGGAGGASDASTADACTPAVIVCGSGSGKRCGKVSDMCTGSIDCGACIAGETCGVGHACSVACGLVGQACCTGSKCTATDTICDNGSCVACGGQNQICCASDACVAAGSTCSESSVPGAAKTCLLDCPAALSTCASGTDTDCATLCGPGRIGVRTCSCSGNAWKCGSCAFSASTDYKCYKLPSPLPACESTTPPTVGTACTTAACSPCGSALGKGFIDALGITRAGYCICDSGRWACGVTKDWPCPGSTGC